MSEEKQGYCIPLPVKYWPRAIAAVLWLILAAVSLASLFPKVRELVDIRDTEWFALRITTIITCLPFLAVGASSFVKLHILPQGIALTLFGRTLRQVSAEKIQIISAVKYSHSMDAVDQIALCLCPPEEGLYLYLRRKSGLFRVNLNLNREILWLDWSPERAKLLMEMYPRAQWMDGSPDRRFNKQLEEFSSDNTR